MFQTLDSYKNKALSEWLSTSEVYDVLKNFRNFGLEFRNIAPSNPISGNLYLFNKKKFRYFRQDGIEWVKRKARNGKYIVYETHVKPKKQVSNDESVIYYTARKEDNTDFQRRVYWLDPVDKTQNEIPVFVHYLLTSAAKQTKSINVLAYSPKWLLSSEESQFLIILEENFPSNEPVSRINGVCTTTKMISGNVVSVYIPRAINPGEIQIEVFCGAALVCGPLKVPVRAMVEQQLNNKRAMPSYSFSDNRPWKIHVLQNLQSTFPGVAPDFEIDQQQHQSHQPQQQQGPLVGSNTNSNNNQPTEIRLGEEGDCMLIDRPNEIKQEPNLVSRSSPMIELPTPVRIDMVGSSNNPMVEDSVDLTCSTSSSSFNDSKSIRGRAKTPIIEGKELYRMEEDKLDELCAEMISNMVNHFVSLNKSNESPRLENSDKPNIQYTPNALDEHGYSLLHYMSLCGLHELVEKLINNGADANIQSIHGDTPLHLACRGGDIETMKLLIKYGIDPYVPNQQGMEPFDFLSKEIRDEIDIFMRNNAPLASFGADSPDFWCSPSPMNSTPFSQLPSQLPNHSPVNSLGRSPPLIPGSSTIMGSSNNGGSSTVEQLDSFKSEKLLTEAFEGLSLLDKCALSIAKLDSDAVEGITLPTIDPKQTTGIMELMNKNERDKLEKEASKIQSNLRAWMLRKNFKTLRKATTSLQAAVRGQMARKNYRQIRSATTVLQAALRGMLARKHFSKLKKQSHAAQLIQKNVRTWLNNRERSPSAAATSLPPPSRHSLSSLPSQSQSVRASSVNRMSVNGRFPVGATSPQIIIEPCSGKVINHSREQQQQQQNQQQNPQQQQQNLHQRQFSRQEPYSTNFRSNISFQQTPSDNGQFGRPLVRSENRNIVSSATSDHNRATVSLINAFNEEKMSPRNNNIQHHQEHTHRRNSRTMRRGSSQFESSTSTNTSINPTGTGSVKSSPSLCQSSTQACGMSFQPTSTPTTVSPANFDGFGNTTSTFGNTPSHSQHQQAIMNPSPSGNNLSACDKNRFQRIDSTTSVEDMNIDGHFTFDNSVTGNLSTGNLNGTSENMSFPLSPFSESIATPVPLVPSIIDQNYHHQQKEQQNQQHLQNRSTFQEGVFSAQQQQQQHQQHHNVFQEGPFSTQQHGQQAAQRHEQDYHSLERENRDFPFDSDLIPLSPNSINSLNSSIFESERSFC